MAEEKFMLTSRLTSEEKEILRHKASRMHMSESSYVRELIRYGLPGEDKAFDENERMLTLKEFSMLIHVSYTKAKKLCQEGEIPYHIICGDYRIKNRDAIQFIENTKQIKEAKDAKMKSLFTVAECAELYRVSPQTVDNWIRRGKMPACRIDGKYLRIRREDIDCMMQEYGL